jgi:hypothetical protein
MELNGAIFRCISLIIHIDGGGLRIVHQSKKISYEQKEGKKICDVLC